jgi:hypothetical protein
VDGAFAAVMIPLGLVAGLIVVFALWTTEKIVIPQFTHKSADGDVRFFGAPIGSTELIHHNVWGIGFIVVFAAMGGGLGYLIGKGLDRLSGWGT